MLAPDIVVIGGGIAGLSCAFYLAKSNLTVHLYDKFTCGSQATGSALGVLWPPSPLRVSVFNTIHRKSLREFPNFISEIEKESGMRIPFFQCGGLEVISTRSQFEMAQREEADPQSRNPGVENFIPLSVRSNKESNDLEPQLQIGEFGAIYAPSCATVSTEKLVQALVLACKRQGVKIIQNTPVAHLKFQHGQITGVETDAGFIPTKLILVAAGYGTSTIDSMLGRFTPIQPVKGQALLVKIDKPLIQRVIRWQRIFLRPWNQHSIAVGSTTERDFGNSLKPSEEGRKELLSKAISVLPSLKTAKVIKQWAGLRPMSIDRKPYLGPVPGVKGLFVAAGYYKVGLALAPVAGQIMRDLIVEGKTNVDISSLQPRECRRS